MKRRRTLRRETWARRKLQRLTYGELRIELEGVLVAETRCSRCQKRIDLFDRDDDRKLGIRCVYCRRVFCLPHARRHFKASRPTVQA